MRATRRIGLGCLVLSAALLVAPVPAEEPGREFGVYVRVLDAPVGAWTEVTTALPGVLERMGWQVLASYDAGTGGCRYRARVLVVADPAWTAAASKGGVSAGFAIPLRVVVFEDETGTHVGLANPQSLARTIIGETGYEAAASDVVNQLAAALVGMPGTVIAAQYGQMRERGLIDKTMGIVAGGPFSTKIEELGSVKAGGAVGVSELAGAFLAAARIPSRRWGLRAVYRYDVPGGTISIVGLTGEKMEAKAFSIVGAGRDAARSEQACPGIDHAPAFPIEIVFAREGNEVRMLAVDAMFRMKMYFEDAGTMKFAANMAMPGSIEEEIRDLAEDAIATLRTPTASR